MTRHKVAISLLHKVLRCKEVLSYLDGECMTGTEVVMCEGCSESKERLHIQPA